MKKAVFCVFFALVFPMLGFGAVHVGVGKTDITPPIDTPSAGYRAREGRGMQGVHDPLMAIALFIDNGEKKVVLCSVDNLGFTYEIVQEIIQKIHAHPGLEACEVYIGSSHTHSGGGAYLDFPVVGKILAGDYNPKIRQFYVDRTAEAILQAYQNQILGKVGIGYGMAAELSTYRSSWPKDVSPLSDVAVIKVTHLDGTPFAVLFNYPVHPTILNSQNLLFSADFIGYARDHLSASLGPNVQPIYFNGAQGDVNPVIFNEEDGFNACDCLGKSLAKTVKTIWDKTEVSESLQIDTQKKTYTFNPQATPFGIALPISTYTSEINLLVFNQAHAFITIPGELSCLYDKQLKEIGRKLGFAHVSIFGLTNDAHGYIISPESWQHKTFESRLSFGGENYGEMIAKLAKSLLKNSPEE